MGINKHNNYAPIPNAPRKLCQNCDSANHLTHMCKKPAREISEKTCGHMISLQDK